MSPRAAWRLDHLGFDDVADYVGGKMDWLAHDLPFEGTADLVGRHVRLLPTCRPSDLVGELAPLLETAPVCAVTVDDGVVVGVLDRHAVEHHTDAKAGEVAAFGTTTVRPSEEREELEKRMRENGVSMVLVTDPAGRLCGLYERSD